MTNSWRNRLAWRLANACLRIATPKYRAMLAGSIEYGLRAATRDEATGVPAPGPWLNAGFTVNSLTGNIYTSNVNTVDWP